MFTLETGHFRDFLLLIRRRELYSFPRFTATKAIISEGSEIKNTSNPSANELHAHKSNFSQQNQPSQEQIHNKSASNEPTGKINDPIIPELKMLLKEYHDCSFLQKLAPTTVFRCYNCGTFGHKAIDCTITSIRKACFNCGSAGHLAKDW